MVEKVGGGLYGPYLRRVGHTWDGKLWRIEPTSVTAARSRGPT